MPAAPESIVLVHPGVANSITVPIAGVSGWFSRGWQLADPDDAQYLTPAPPTPTLDVITRDELDAFVGDLSTTLVSQINDVTSDLRAALDALYGSPVSNIPTLAASGPGWAIAANSLDVWRASKASPTALTEVVVFGDSTTQGSGDETGGGYVPELRRQAITDGLGDGGQGLARYSMSALESGDNLAPVFAQTATGVTNGNFDIYTANTPVVSNIGDTITYQGRGTRLRLYYTRQNTTGRFSYAIDGGSAVTVDAYQNTSNSRIGVVEVDGLTEGLHKVVVTNLGRSGNAYPTINNLNFGPANAANGFTPSTQYYVATATTASGETLPSPVESKVVPGGFGLLAIAVTLNSFDAPGVTGYKVYRSSTGSAGSFQYVGSAAHTGSFTSFTDDNTVTPGAAAPTTNTSGLTGTSPGTMRVDTEWTRETGVVFHNNGVSGIQYDQYFYVDNPNLNTATQAAFGLVQGGTPTTDHLQPPDTTPPWRSPALAISALGINDLQGSGGTTGALNAALAKIQGGAAKFADFCTARGCDGLLVVPHFKRALYGDTAFQGSTAAQVFSQAIIDVADERGLSWVSFDRALDDNPEATNAGVHQDHIGYVTEGQFAWTNVLSK